MKPSEFSRMPEIVVTAKSSLEPRFSAAKGMFSLSGHEKFSHKLRFDKEFSYSGIQLASAKGWKTSTGNETDYVTRMAAACPKTKN